MEWLNTELSILSNCELEHVRTVTERVEKTSMHLSDKPAYDVVVWTHY